MKEIDLRICQISDEGCKALADALKINSAVKEIDVRSNQISDDGCKALADALKINATAKEIDLDPSSFLQTVSLQRVLESLVGAASAGDFYTAQRLADHVKQRHIKDGELCFGKELRIDEGDRKSEKEERPPRTNKGGGGGPAAVHKIWQSLRKRPIDASPGYEPSKEMWFISRAMEFSAAGVQDMDLSPPSTQTVPMGPTVPKPRNAVQRFVKQAKRRLKRVFGRRHDAEFAQNNAYWIETTRSRQDLTEALEEARQRVETLENALGLNEAAISSHQQSENELEQFICDLDIQLNNVTLEQLQKVRGFMTSRNKLNAVAAELLPKQHMNDFCSLKPPCVRQSMTGVEQVMESAKAALPAFMEVMKRIIKSQGMDPDEIVIYEGEPLRLNESTHYRRLTQGLLKTQERLLEKVDNEYEGDVSRVVDAVRCSIVADTEEQLVALAQALNDENIIVRFKNRFREPLWNGYRDGLYNVRVSDHVCEVQLHLAALLRHKQESHVYYEFFRSFFVGKLEACNERMKLLQKIVDDSSDLQNTIKSILNSRDPKTLEHLGNLANLLGDRHLGLLVCHRLLKLDPTQLRYMCRLGRALRLCGRTEEARVLFEKCLDQCKVSLPENHPNTLVSLNNMADVLKQQGNYEEAAVLYQECHAQAVATFGEKDRCALGSLNGLAGIHKCQGHWPQAEALYRECADGLKAVLGEDDPQTLGSLNDLALVLSSRGSHEEARELHQHCLSKRRANLGDTHPDVLASLNNLALVLDRLGNYEEAEAMYRKCSRNWAVAHGDTHPGTRMSFRNLAKFLYQRGRYDEADLLFNSVGRKVT